MTKFHINKHGAPAPCRAQKGKCPLGGDSGKENHFDNKEEAQNHADKINEAEYNLMPVVSDESKQEKTRLTPAQQLSKDKKEQKERLTEKLNSYWTESDGTIDTKMVKHCLNNVKYVEIGDSFVEVGDLKPKIHKELLYDDEQDAPEINFKTFRDYNARMSMPKKYESTGTNFNGTGTLKMVNEFENSEEVGLSTLTSLDPEYIKGDYKEVSEKELEEINKGVDEVRENYEKRLKSYFDKYEDKITTRGYWKNR